MRTHHLKLRIEFCDDVVSGVKSFEIRKNDRGFQRGDRIVFQAVERDGINVYECPHEINNLIFEITYMLNGYGLENGYLALAIKNVERIEDEREYE